MPTKPPVFVNKMNQAAKKEANRVKRAAKAEWDNSVYNADWAKFRKWNMSQVDPDGMSRQLCRPCYDEGTIKLADVLDHTVPTRVDDTRILDATNVTPMCNAHHAIKSQEDYRKYPETYGSVAGSIQPTLVITLPKQPNQGIAL